MKFYHRADWSNVTNFVIMMTGRDNLLKILSSRRVYKLELGPRHIKSLLFKLHSVSSSLDNVSTTVVGRFMPFSIEFYKQKILRMLSYEPSNKHN
jgi:hypothetical protein